jgi:hypothetical protein
MITVTISKATLRDFGADIHAGIHVLEALRKAGVPVLGTLLPMGVSEGVLTSHDDAMVDAIVWQWDGELENLA